MNNRKIFLKKKITKSINMLANDIGIFLKRDFWGARQLN